MTDETIARHREFPQNYSPDVVDILRAMSFTDGKDLMIVGSGSLRSQQYIADYDGVEMVKVKYDDDETALDLLADSFQDIIKTLRGMKNVIIGDIKGGEVSDWRVFPEDAGIVEGKIVGYNATALRGRVDDLKRDKIISPAVAKGYMDLLVDSPSIEQFLVARNAIRPHIMRWTPGEVLQGFIDIPGRKYTLQDAFSSRGITKLDVIGWVHGNVFRDFSVIYSFENKGKILNPHPFRVRQSLQEDIEIFRLQGFPFKATKRRFALAKWDNDYETMEKLQPILNGDLGRIYALKSDIDTLVSLLERSMGSYGMEKMHFEIGQFRDRLAHIWTLPDFLFIEPSILGKLDLAMRHPPTKAGSQHMMRQLKEVSGMLQEILVKHTPTDLIGGGYFPSKYFKGLSAADKKKRKKEIIKFGSMSHKDPAAYVGFETDKGVETKPSTWTEKWNKRFPDAKSLEEKAKASGVPVRFLRKSFNRGKAAWRTGHRPGATPEQWGYARVSSLLMGGPTSKTTDSDLVEAASKASKKAAKWFSGV
jgi:hypothetical protein